LLVAPALNQVGIFGGEAVERSEIAVIVAVFSGEELRLGMRESTLGGCEPRNQHTGTAVLSKDEEFWTQTVAVSGAFSAREEQR
jgi:hypothetical protein